LDYDLCERVYGVYQTTFFKKVISGHNILGISVYVIFARDLIQGPFIDGRYSKNLKKSNFLDGDQKYLMFLIAITGEKWRLVFLSR